MRSTLRLVSRLATVPALALMLAAGASAQTVQRDVPYVPTPEHVVKRMLELAQIKKGEFMMDLGSGDGRIAIAAARDFGARAVGIDIDPQRIKEANENVQKNGVGDRVRILQADLFEANISEATVVTLYLLPSLNLKLMPKLMKELKPGTRIVSHAFDMGDWKPEQELDVNNRKVYFWTIPKK
jgi:ribosomal protein L11 methylase PrmA